ncbi:MAG TPA: hypothetical protein VER83_08060 [Candidatus Nanopelagicales bacterium]|nr:hypothetical protein [Candidatus Nanopelagicales bacterium]
MPILGLITRFVLAGVIGLGGALGVAAATAPPTSNLLPGPEAAFELTADTGDQVAAFGLTAVPDQEPVALQALPDDAVLQLVSFIEPGTEPGTGGASRPAWLLPTGYPRVPPITQFDGGQLGPANCTMASGAMLARLGYGIVTTGSQLRALQADQVGGTSLADLQAAIATWGVSFSQGAISPLQLRALLYAGAGAVLQVAYGAIPVSLRLQADFTGGHAIYLDGFRPAGTDGPAAYFVIDPLGPTWAGYKGAWWPAGIVEAAALAFGGGTAYTAWAFPGGTAPANPPLLPPSAFPDATLAPGETPDPSATSTPIPSSPPLPSPEPSLIAPPAGDLPPIVPSDWWIPKWKDVFEGGVVMSPIWTACIVDPAPWCPGGIIGIWPPQATAPPTLPPFQVVDVDLLFANPIGGGLMQVIFDVPDGATPYLQFWNADEPTGMLGTAPSIEAALLDGKKVQVATFPIEQGVDYNFVASAQALGVKAISQVGTAGP